MRIGIGYDSHRFVEGRKLILGGVDIPFDKGLMGHSDGDALCHAITDAIIGALGQGDIGRHFPDSDSRWKDASSVLMLKEIVGLALSEGFEIAWIDCVIITERPKLASFIDGMKQAMSHAGIPSGIVNIKAKTDEKMGFVGREEGLAVHAVCLLLPRTP